MEKITKNKLKLVVLYVIILIILFSNLFVNNGERISENFNRLYLLVFGSEDIYIPEHVNNQSSINVSSNLYLNKGCKNVQNGLNYFEMGYYKLAKENFNEVLTINSTIYPCYHENNSSFNKEIIEKVYIPLITIYISEGRIEEANTLLQIANKLLTEKNYKALSIDKFRKQTSTEIVVALPYLQYKRQTHEVNKVGVTIHKKDKIDNGYIYFSNSFWDLKGNLVKLGDFKDVYNISNITFRYLDFLSNNFFIHHDWIALNDGTYIVISKKIYNYSQKKVEFDEIIHTSKKGDEILRWSTYENLKEIQKYHSLTELDLNRSKIETNKSKYKPMIGGDYDYYHMNSVQVLKDNPLAKSDKRFQKGNWLISLRNVNLILIIDKNTKEIVWVYGLNKLDNQHTPRMLDNGNILIFDNGRYRNYSRVIELNPIRKEIVWEYKGEPKESFFSKYMGSAQRLPNGNTLITESSKGRIFEITKDKEIVWEFYNPLVNKENRSYSVYRAIKFNKENIDGFIEKETSK